MSKKTGLEIKAEKDIEHKAQFVHESIVKHSTMAKTNIKIMAVALREMKNNNLYIPLGYPSFEAYCVDPDVNIMPASANKYIRILDALDDKKVKFDEIKNLDMVKLEIISKLKDPVKWITKAEVLTIMDLRKEVLQHEHGIDVDKEENKRYIDHAGCPKFKGGKCSAGVEL